MRPEFTHCAVASYPNASPGRGARSRILGFLFACSTFLIVAPAAGADLVTRATDLADEYGEGLANWRTLAIMHQAMHDAANAVKPTYERWEPPGSDEPDATGASVESTMVAAAARVLTLLHPERQEQTASALSRAFFYIDNHSAHEASLRLGTAIGEAAVRRRENDGKKDTRAFVGRTGAGVWARTPEQFETSYTSSTAPFLFPDRASFAAPPPPSLDSELFLRDVEEVRKVGGRDSTDRTEDQTYSAIFWAGQSSQRGFVHLGIRLLERRPRPGGVIEHARIMSQLATGMADTAILIWLEKERFSFWRPVTVIRAGSEGVIPDPTWLASIETPPFPEYPSGHSADCYTGSAILRAAFGTDVGALTYVSMTGKEKALSELASGVGQHDQSINPLYRYERDFPSLEAAAENCAESRIWAGAHFRFSNVESKRVSDLIAARAAAAVPLLRR